VSVGINSVDAVLSRISQIQAQVALLSQPSSASTVTSGATSSLAATSGSSDFAAALSTASTNASAGAVTGGSSSGVTGQQIVESAKKYLGVPYVFGGTTSAGIDCSGLVQRAYGDLGITLPRLSWDQAKVGTAVPDLAHAQPGDILGFGNPAEHVAIYLGNNMMIAAPQPGENVKIQSVYETPASIRRVAGTDLDPTVAAAGSSGAAAATTGTAAVTSAYSSGVAAYRSLFAANEARYKLPTGMLAAVAQTESGGNANAVSPAGAQGLMQLMPGTAAGLGVDPFNPAQAVQGAAELFSNYLRTYKSIPLALAAYNAGPGAVNRYGGVPPYSETQNYVRKITSLMGVPA
jgi:cell wall-associated NlpC family hydrolase